MAYKHISLTQSQRKFKQNSLSGPRHWTAVLMIVVLGYLLLETQNAMAADPTQQHSLSTMLGNDAVTRSDNDSIVLVRLITPATRNAAARPSVTFPKSALGPNVLWLLSLVSLILAGGSYAISRMIVPADNDGNTRSAL